MFYNTPNGLQLETENGWTISISLAGAEARKDCEIAVWPTDLGSRSGPSYLAQNTWVRWGANGAEPPDFPIYDRVLSGLTTTELLRIINRLSTMTGAEVVPNKWLSKGFTMESKWR